MEEHRGMGDMTVSRGGTRGHGSVWGEHRGVGSNGEGMAAGGVGRSGEREKWSQPLCPR